MLPYTPLHHLLLAAVARPIVLTSGNVSDEPIAYRDDDAQGHAGGIADAFLTHDRAIHVRTDDSVARTLPRPPDAAPPLPRLRPRARSPSPPVPAAGAGLRRRAEEHVLPGPGAPRLRLAPHRGPGERRDAALVHRGHRALPPAVRHRPAGRGARPAPGVPVHQVRARAGPCAAGGVQHHHAHIASCLADNGEDGPVIGVAFDGTGYGTDGTIWGGEFLVAGLAAFERGGHLAPVPMPGGAAAIRQPWRMAARLHVGDARGSHAATRTSGPPWSRWPPRASTPR